MTEATEHLVIALDGSEACVTLPCGVGRGERIEAPAWLVRQMKLATASSERWWLVPLVPPRGQAKSACGDVTAQPPPKLCLVRAATAGAFNAPFDPRQERLKTERRRLEKLNEESDYVRVEPLDVLNGSEPEHYRVTFLCRGIVGIDAAQSPLYGNRHQVEIACNDDFPADVPSLRWITDIWHPNIQHTGSKGVCVNKPEWLGGMGLDDLCRMMFEMVQYKNYHAELTLPGPLDGVVAQWVRQYAEPRGIVNKNRGIFVDDRPFTRPTVTSFINVVPSATPVETAQKRVRLVQPSQPETSRAGSIRVLGASRSEASSEITRPPSVIKIRKSE